MKAPSRMVLVVAASLLAVGAAHAADPPAPATVAASAVAAPLLSRVDTSAKDPTEPVVQRTVIDDGRAVIEELRVRGQLVKATVHPKDGSPAYEIIVGDGSRELSMEGRNN